MSVKLLVEEGLVSPRQAQTNHFKMVKVRMLKTLYHSLHY
jgi:hypothetical protein